MDRAWWLCYYLFLDSLLFVHIILIISFMYVVLCFIFVIFLQVHLYTLESISQYFENVLLTEFETNQFIRRVCIKNENLGAV